MLVFPVVLAAAWCAIAFELVVESARTGASLLDIGCGTGILAISAAKLGYKPVEAFDFDPVLFEMPFVRETLKLDGHATFTADGNPCGLRTHPDRKGEEKNDQNGNQPLRGVAPREATASAMVVRY